MPAIVSQEVRRSYREPGHSPPSSAEGNDADAKRCVYLYSRMSSWCRISLNNRGKENFTLPSKKTQGQIFLWERLNCEILHVRVIPWAGSLVYLAHKRDVSLQ